MVAKNELKLVLGSRNHGILGLYAMALYQAIIFILNLYLFLKILTSRIILILFNKLYYIYHNFSTIEPAGL